jgi:hypothetical protein
MAYTKFNLSGSVDGCPIVVNSVSGGTSGTAGTIHQAPAGTDGWDEIWIYAYNAGTTSQNLTIEWGTAGAGALAGSTIPIASQTGDVLVKPGFILRNGLVVRAFAGSAGIVAIDGYVNRIT